jgi:hypothetical protein
MAICQPATDCLRMTDMEFFVIAAICMAATMILLFVSFLEWVRNVIARDPETIRDLKVNAVILVVAIVGGLAVHLVGPKSRSPDDMFCPVGTLSAEEQRSLIAWE